MIYEKLAKCRVELQEMKLKKSGKNKFAGFSYYELADFLPIVNKLFMENKLFANFSMCETMARLTINDYEDNTKEYFETPIAELELKGCNKIQALGGTHTYLKRYLYINALEIVENDLFDAVVGKEKTQDIGTEEFINEINASSDISQLIKLYNENKDYIEANKTILNALKNKKIKLTSNTKPIIGAKDETK